MLLFCCFTDEKLSPRKEDEGLPTIRQLAKVEARSFNHGVPALHQHRPFPHSDEGNGVCELGHKLGF